MYVDESGDTGLDGSPTDHFVLTGFVVHEADWLDYLERLIAFRRRMACVPQLISPIVHDTCHLSREKASSRAGAACI
jgi:hypothetical protein